jgi:hypothetical protein
LSDHYQHTPDACSDEPVLESCNIRPLPSDDDDDFEPISLNSWSFEVSAVAPLQNTESEMSERGLSSATNGFKSTTLPALNDSWEDHLEQRLTKKWQSSQETRAALSRQLTSTGGHSFMVTPTPIVHDHFHSAAMSGTVSSNRSVCTPKGDSEGIEAVPTEHPFNRTLAPAKRASVDSCGTAQTSRTTMDSIHTPPAHSLLNDPCYPRYPHSVTIVSPRLTKSKKPVKWKSSAQSQQILHQIHALSVQTKQCLLHESSAGSSQALCRKAVPDSTSGVAPPDHPNLRASMRRSQHSRRGLAALTPPHNQGCAISKNTALRSNP